MAWETFRRRNKPSPKEPMVSLSKTGIIGLNAAVTRNLIGENRFAHLLFDREKGLIGIKFIRDGDLDAYPVKCTKNMSHGSIAGVSFLKTYGVFPDETTAYPANFDESNKILVVDVSGKKNEKPEPKKPQRFPRR